MEWGLYKILEYMELHVILPPGQGRNRNKLKKDVKEYHLAYNINFEEADQETSISRRPDEPASIKKRNHVCSQDTPQQWTPTRTGPRRRSRKKTTDTAHI